MRDLPTGYDIPWCVEDGAWMLWENFSVAVAAVAVAAVAHPDLGNGQLSVFITTPARPECADRSVSSSEYYSTAGARIKKSGHRKK